MTEKAEAVLREIEEQAQTEFLPIIGPQKGRWLVETLKKVKAVTVLEVGTLVGYSAVLMADNLPVSGIVHTIEINPDLSEISRSNIARAGLSSKVEVHVGDALKVIPQLKLGFDMLFVDAAKDEYFKYLKLAEDKLRRGGAVFADNAGIFADNMRDYLDYVKNSGKYSSEYHAAGRDGVEISIKL